MVLLRLHGSDVAMVEIEAFRDAWNEVTYIGN